MISHGSVDTSFSGNCATSRQTGENRILPFGLRYPIWQAPTGSVAGPELCAAVATAGGMGAMALTWTEPETAASYVRQVRALTDRPFLVNFALAFPPLGLDEVLNAGAPAISFSWGEPEPFLPRVRAAGARIGIQVTTVEQARRAVGFGADFLLCQGIEAGGHVESQIPLSELLNRLRQADIEAPLIASGGIADGTGIAMALRAGADGAMLGTRFVATRESRAHPDYKRLLCEATDHATALTFCFQDGWPDAAQRVLRNETLDRWEAAGCPCPGERPGEGDTLGYTSSGEPIFRYEDTAPRQGFTGTIDAMCLYAGTGCSLIYDVPSASDLVHRLWRETQSALTNLKQP